MLKDIGLIGAVGGAVLALAGFLIKYTVALAKGVQALLRTQLYEDYTKYRERGYAPIDARQNFENCYQRYHRLGKNGVMDDIHEKFLSLPVEADNTEDKNEKHN